MTTCRRRRRVNCPGIQTVSKFWVMSLPTSHLLTVTTVARVFPAGSRDDVSVPAPSTSFAVVRRNDHGQVWMESDGGRLTTAHTFDAVVDESMSTVRP